MELDYFISGSLVEQSFVKDKWLDTTALATRSFNTFKEYSFTGIDGSQDFSLFFTLDKKTSGAGSLFSNYELGQTSGFAICYNSNNELFVKNFGTPVYAETVSNLRLGQKNCLGIVKNNRGLTFYKYNLNGTGISQEQTVLFPKEYPIGGTRYILGFNTGTNIGLGIPGVSGLFDQMVSFNTALTKDQSLSIFSGFQPYTKTLTPYYLKTQEYSGYERQSGSVITDQDIREMSPIFNEFSATIPSTTGNYVSIFTGTFSSGGLATWSGSYALGKSLTCYSTGTISSVFGTGVWAASSIAAFQFNDSIYASMNNSGERVVSHFVSYKKLPSTTEDFFIYNLYQKYNSGVSGTLVLTESYKTGFFMNGVVTNNNSGFTLLSNVSGEKYNTLNYDGTFNRTVGLFSVDARTQSGSRVYWGTEGKITNFTLASGYIDLSGIVEDDSYPLMYDLGTGNPTFLQTTFENFATGRFDQDTALVFTGISSWGIHHRIKKENFWETSLYHLAHGDSRVLPTGTPIYLNSQDYWM